MGVVQAELGAVRLGEFKLFIRRCARDHFQPKQLAEFASRKAGAVCRAKHCKRLAAFRAGAILQRMQRGAIGDDDSGGAIEIEVRGNLDDGVRRQSDLFARPVVAARGDDAITGLEVADATADALDHAGHFGGR